MGQSAIYQDTQIKSNLMKVVFKMQLDFLHRPGWNSISMSQRRRITANHEQTHIYLYQKADKNILPSFSIKYLQSCQCLQRMS